MLPPGLETPTQVKRYYDNLYLELTSPTTGSYYPFVYPWFTLGFGFIVIYFLLDHRRSTFLQALRFPLFFSLCTFSAWILATVRARSAAAAYGTGLVTAWGTLWTATLMFFNDFQRDFQRMQYRNSVGFGSTRAATSNGATNAAEKDSKNVAIAYGNSRANETGPIIWQKYPEAPFLERLDWVLDLFTNFRGIGWNFQIPDIPPPPSWVEADLQAAEKPTATKKSFEVDTATSTPRASPALTTSRTGLRRLTSRRDLLIYCLIRLTIGYIALDVIKLAMHHDPYFWGYTSHALGPAYLPESMRNSPILTHSLRLLIALAAIYTALHQIFRLGPLLFSCIIGPSILGLRGEAFMNIPDFYGDLTPVLDRGLAGFWSGHWHQTFRYAFEAPSRRLFKLTGMSPRSDLARLLGSLIAFGLSAMLHCIGSYTQLGETRPVWGAARFFLLQPLGLFAQVYFIRALRAVGVAKVVPTWLGRVTNFVAVYVWLYWTAGLLVGDFADGGVWLFEPVPMSPLRGLGLGAKDDAERWWWLWDGMVFVREDGGLLYRGLAF